MIKGISILVLCMLFAELSILKAQNLITVYPEKNPLALSNPLKGFRPDGPSTKYPRPTIARVYIPWNEIENDSTDGVQKIIDYCNVKWKDYEKKNVKVIPRVFILWDGNSMPGNWPSDLTPGDWTSQKFKDRAVKLIYKLGLAWDNDPRVAWVQTGIMGWWGEQESPVGINEEYAKLLGDAFSAAFKNKKIIVRNQGSWEGAGYRWGTYWDSYGHPGQSGVRSQILARNMVGRFKTEIIEGETAYNWGADTWNPKYGASPTLTLNNYKFTNNIIDAIMELHCTGLGWLASYDLNGADGSNIDTVKANASKIQKIFGYNYVISEFSCSTRVDQGSDLAIHFTVKNTGSAPIYENWPLTFVLIDEATQEIVWKETISSVDIRTWLPGDAYSLVKRSYQTLAKEYVIDATFKVPGTIPTGQYMAGITILEPYSQTPGVFFDVKNFLTKSQTQPLCRIAIGQDLAGDYQVNPVILGDPVVNDTRSYSLTPKGFGYNLTTSITNGTIVIHPAGGKYLPGAKVTVIVKSNFGYKLNSWSGDLSGSETVTTITMDGDKSITANLEKLITYELIKSSINGLINITPSGSVFVLGTNVTIKAIPAFGYKFSGWSGDLSGIDNPASVVMNSNKNITANFEAVPTYDLATSALNGYINSKPTGGIFEEGTNVFIKAIPDFGYQFSGWSGDLSGMENPTTIVIDANKSITANFTKLEGNIVFATNCGGAAFTSGDGVSFTADSEFSSGSTYSTSSAIAGTTDDVLYQSERYGTSFSYNIPLPNGTYQIMLMFAENYFSSANSRVFNVAIEGNTVLSNLDIWSAAGAKTAYNTIHLVTLTDGELNIAFTGATENAKVSAIKILQINPPTGIKNVLNNIPGKTNISKIFPNPFKAETTVQYQLSETMPVKLSIYNSIGELMTTMVNDYQSAGNYSVNWNATDRKGKILENGLYLFKLETGNKTVQTMKAILLR